MGPSEDLEVGPVLIVDADGPLLDGYVRALTEAGFRADGAGDAGRAVALLQRRRYGVIAGNAALPGLDGLALLRMVRQRDLDVPVLLLAASPTDDLPARAVEFGALRCLSLPLEPAALVAAVGQAGLVHRLARLRRQAIELFGAPNRQLGDRVALEAGFERAMGALWIAYQPIVSCIKREIYGFEASLRSYEPTLPAQDSLLDAAGRLGRLPELGRAIRDRVATAVNSAHAQAVVVELRPGDLLDESLYRPASPLSQVASKVVLSLSERIALDDVPDLRARAAALRAVGFRLAVSELGAGYAGVTTLAKLEPDLVRLDPLLVRELPISVARQSLIRSLVALCGEMGIAFVAVGVETLEQREALLAAGCELLQGDLFAKADRPFPTVSARAYSGANQRDARRVGTSRIEVRLLDLDRLQTHPLRDISEKGALIMTDAHLPMGAETHVELCGEGDPLRLTARVVREVGEGGRRVGFGIRFVFNSGAAEAQLRNLVARYSERLQPEAPGAPALK